MKYSAFLLSILYIVIFCLGCFLLVEWSTRNIGRQTQSSVTMKRKLEVHLLESEHRGRGGRIIPEIHFTIILLLMKYYDNSYIILFDCKQAFLKATEMEVKKIPFQMVDKACTDCLDSQLPGTYRTC